MKKLVLFVILMFAIFFGTAFVGMAAIYAQDELPVAEDAVEEPEVVKKGVTEEEGSSIMPLIWSFLNSPVGVSAVVFVLSFILGKVFTAKPKWKALILKFGPSIMQAVKYAEKQIPDDTHNKGLERVNSALKYLITLQPKLKGIAEDDLKEAISAVHASAEANGNLKQG